MKRALRTTILAAAIMSFTLTVSAQQAPEQRDSLLADFDLFIEYVEATHPDPYTPMGGRPYFARRAQQMRERITAEPMTKDQYIEMLSDMFTELHDGHTWIRTATSKPDVEGRVGMYLRALPDGVIFNLLPQSQRQYLGMRLKAVDGVPADKIIDAAEARYGCENRSSAMAKLCNTATYLSTYARALSELRDSLTITVSDAQGADHTFTMPVMQQSQWQSFLRDTAFVSLPHDKRFDAGNLEYRTIDCGDKQVMYMRIAGIYGRECFEYMHRNGMPGWQDNLAYFYNRFMSEPMPDDPEEAIRRTPAFSERFAEMLSEMKRDGTETLIIDLRNNGGGWTPITLATIYMLYGDDYLTTPMGTTTARRISPLYLEKVNMTLEEFNRSNGTTLRMGDYIFYEDDGGDDTSVEIKQVRRNFIDNAMTASAKLLRKLDGKPLYRPAQVYVVTDGNTFSAAFHYAFFLRRMGAKVVGLPSGQAPNTYMEQTLFKLPRTGIEGQISNCLQLFLPPEDPRAKTFTPDIVFTPEQYASCGWDDNAELILLLQQITAE